MKIQAKFLEGGVGDRSSPYAKIFFKKENIGLAVCKVFVILFNKNAIVKF